MALRGEDEICWVASCKSHPRFEPLFPHLSNGIQNLCLDSTSESVSAR